MHFIRFPCRFVLRNANQFLNALRQTIKKASLWGEKNKEDTPADVPVICPTSEEDTLRISHSRLFAAARDEHLGVIFKRWGKKKNKLV